MFKENISSKNHKQVKPASLPIFNPNDFKSTRMTVKQAMDCFDVCRTTIFNWERNNILIAKRIGRRVYYILNPKFENGEFLSWKNQLYKNI